MVVEDAEYLDYNADAVLNPDWYLHLTIMQAILAPHKALQQPQQNPKNGLISLIVAVDQLEKIAKASGRLVDYDEYKEKVKEYEEELKAKERDEFLFKALVANYKLQLLLETIFKVLPRKGDLVI